MNRPDKASTQFLLDAIAPIEAEALNGKNWQTRITNSQVRFLIEKFREALADRDQLEQQLAESPREITGDQLTKDMLVWEEHSTVNWQLPSQALLESSTYNQQKYIVKPKPVVEDETFNIGSVQIEEEDQHSHSTVHCTGCKELVDSRTRIALKYVLGLLDPPQSKTLEEVLGEHRVMGDPWFCKCGHQMESFESYDDHLAQVLRESGLLKGANE